MYTNLYNNSEFPTMSQDREIAAIAKSMSVLKLLALLTVLKRLIYYRQSMLKYCQSSIKQMQHANEHCEALNIITITTFYIK